MKKMKIFLRIAQVIVVIFLLQPVAAQNILDRKITLEVKQQRLDDVLAILSNKASFSFSYNSNILKRDSLVSVSAANKPVRQILNQLFANNYEFKESGNYVIVRRVAMRVSTVTKTVAVTENIYTISGYVVNAETGERIVDASVYDTKHLASTLTDGAGNFILKLKSKYKTASLSVSKYAFEDTVVTIQPKYDMQLVIAIVPVIDTLYTAVPNLYEIADTANIVKPDTAVVKKDSIIIDVEKTAAGRFLLSTKQKIRSLNLKKFFTEKPFQISVIPGVSTQGKLSSQVVNNFSVNLFGGFTGGVNGVELGGLFNLNRKDVRYLQAGGLFNIVGGSVTGLQLAGLHNNVLKNTTGLQAGGISNYVRENLCGVQLAGIHNHVGGTVKGWQTGGVTNYARGNVNGVQLAGVANFSNRDMNGVQIGGVFNYAKRMRGLQIGLINVSDSSDGFSIGLITIVFKGYHKLSFSTNEVVNGNVAFKTGSRKFYNILQAGMNLENGKDQRLYTFGYGLGTELGLAKWLSLNPEISSQYLYLGTWDHMNLLNKLYLNLNIKLGKRFSIFAGPSFNVYYSNQPAAVSGYKFDIVPKGYNSFDFGSNKVKGWFGWNAGINIF
jgi:hypothetical protein